MNKIKFASIDDILNITVPANEGKSNIPFLINGERKVVNNNYNTVVIADDHIQKNEKVIKPYLEQICLFEESFVINVKSKKMYDKYSSLVKDKGYKVVCLDFDNPINSDSINILGLAYELYKDNNYDKANEIINSISNYIFYDDQSKIMDPFWINTSKDLFMGLVLYLFEKNEKVDINSIRSLMDTIKIDDIEKGSVIYNYLARTLLAPVETRGGIYATFNQYINLISTKETLCKSLFNDGFDLKELTNKKVALFMIEDTTLLSSKLVSLIINQIYYICSIYDNSNKLNLIIDGLDEICPIVNIEGIFNAFRDYNVTITTFIKSFKKLESIYNEDGIPIVVTYFKNILYLLSSDLSTLEHISQLCGSIDYISNLMNIKDTEGIYIIIRNLPFIINI